MDIYSYVVRLADCRAGEVQMEGSSGASTAMLLAKPHRFRSQPPARQARALTIFSCAMVSRLVEAQSLKDTSADMLPLPIAVGQQALSPAEMGSSPLNRTLTRYGCSTMRALTPTTRSARSVPWGQRARPPAGRRRAAARQAWTCAEHAGGEPGAQSVREWPALYSWASSQV